MTTMVCLDGLVVATVGARAVYLAPDVEALPADDARRRTVQLMCEYALVARIEDVPYDDERALRFAEGQLER